jgi:hypothetical protein
MENLFLMFMLNFKLNTGYCCKQKALLTNGEQGF